MLRPLTLILAFTPLLVGAVRCAATSGRPHVFACARAQTAPAPLHQDARCDHGATVSASSTDYEHGHHPLFAVDGRVGGSFETWANFPGDAAPWMEVSLPTPSTARTLVLHHRSAGAPLGAARAFAVRVQLPGGWTEVRRAAAPEGVSSTVPLPAGPLSGIRVEFSRGGPGAATARLAEVELLGN